MSMDKDLILLLLAAGWPFFLCVFESLRTGQDLRELLKSCWDYHVNLLPFLVCLIVAGIILAVLARK